MPIKMRPIRRRELDLLIAWAAKEGWNPGVYDAEAFWVADPEGFVVAELNDEVIGGGAIVKYDDKLGFMGLFIIRPEFRGQGFGRELWYQRRDLLRSRLNPGATIGMMGVEVMQDFYHKGDFNYYSSAIRFGGRVNVPEPKDALIVELNKVDFRKIVEFDRKHFGAARPTFLRKWIAPEAGKGLALLNDDGEIEGIGIIRLTMNGGFKIGPLFANTKLAADTVFRSLACHAQGEKIYIDPPSNNLAALGLCANYGMEKQFVCGLMYYGQPLKLPWNNIYGFTSFELG